MKPLLVSVTIYSRPNCHLCDQMKAVVARVAQSLAFAVEHIDISGNRDLESRYGDEVPVLELDGQKAAKYRITETELVRIVKARTDGPGVDGSKTREGN